MTTSAPTTATSGSGRGLSLPRKIASILVVLVGVMLIVVTFTDNLFKVGPAFENLSDGFRPIMTQQSIATARQDVAGLSAVGQEFQTKVAPGMAQQLKLTPDQFSGMVSQQFPAVDAGLKAIPQAVPAFNSLLSTLDAQRSLFASADAIPTKSLPATTVPWGLLGAGILCILLGVAIWFSRRAGAFLTLIVGVVLIAAPLLLSLPQKASDADQMNANLKPVYTQAMITQSKQTLTTIGAMGQEMQTKMLPALATQLQMQPDQLQAFLGQNFPTTATALRTFPATMQRFQNLVSTFDQNLSNYQTLKPVAFVPIIWTLIGSGIALVLFGGVALAGAGRATAG